MLGPALLTIFINDLEKGIKRTISQFPDDTKQGWSADLLECKKPADRLD